MPKIAKHNRSPLQEKLLMALSLLACTVGQGAWFNTGAIGRVLGGRWTEYRQRELDAMIATKWVQACTPLGSKEGNYYKLTPAALGNLSLTYDPRPEEYLLPDEYDIYLGKAD